MIENTTTETQILDSKKDTAPVDDTKKTAPVLEMAPAPGPIVSPDAGPEPGGGDMFMPGSAPDLPPPPPAVGTPLDGGGFAGKGGAPVYQPPGKGGRDFMPRPFQEQRQPFFQSGFRGFGGQMAPRPFMSPFGGGGGMGGMPQAQPQSGGMGGMGGQPNPFQSRPFPGQGTGKGGFAPQPQPPGKGGSEPAPQPPQAPPQMGPTGNPMPPMQSRMGVAADGSQFGTGALQHHPQLLPRPLPQPMPQPIYTDKTYPPQQAISQPITLPGLMGAYLNQNPVSTT